MMCWCPAKEETIGAVATLLQQGLSTNLQYDTTYMPNPTTTQQEVLLKILTQGENNPYWHMPQHCKHCNRKNVKHTKLHKILECTRHKEKRKSIFESILTKLNFYTKKYFGHSGDRYAIISEIPYNYILDATVTGTIEGLKPLKETLITLTGGNINPKLKDNVQQHIAKMMTSHLILLANTLTNITTKPKQWTLLPSNITIATDYLKQGKIVARQQLNDNTIQYRNIRQYIENLTMPEIHNYNIGIGTANIRTNKQTFLAKEYTEHMMNQAANHIILVDASMNTKDDSKPAKQRRIEKTKTP